MSYTYPSGNPTFDLCRLLIPDTSFLPDVSPPQMIFTDAEIDLFLQAESSQSLYASGQANPTAYQTNSVYIPQIYSPFFSAALALTTLANLKGKLAGMLQLLDVKLDLSKASQALREGADELRSREVDRGNFAIAEQICTEFQARERTINQWLRLYGS